MSENFAELLEESLGRSVMKPGAVIEAEVVDISADFITVNAGLKSEAEIPVSQFKDAAGDLGITVGEKVEVAIEVVEDGFGNTRLSRERARRARSWETLQTAFEEQTIVSGNITGTVKGGFTVAINSVRAFLPGSLVDIRPISDMAYLENRELEFKVIKLDRSRNNVVVSRRAVVEKEMEAERKQLLENIEEGQIIRGIVKNLTDYGAFVNLEIDVRVLKFDRDRNRVSLGMKQLGEDPWTDISRRYPESSRLFGKVTNVTDYGAFVELEEGIEGLVHVSEMDWTNRNIHPNKVCHVGDEIEVMVLDVDSERRRVSLGIKQCKANPWEEFAAIHKKGDQISGQIKSITDFGVFIGLEGGIDGLIHLSDLSWDETGEDVARNYNKGDEVTAIVLAVDADRERISLGLKQAQQDPFLSFVSENPKGSIVSGTIVSVDAKAAVIKLVEGVEGMLRATELSRDYVEDARMSLKEGESVESKITSIERKDRRITLSIKALDLDLESQAIKDYGTQRSATTSLGEKLKEQLEKAPESS